MIDFIKSYEATKAKRHLVWINLGVKEIFDSRCHADIVSPNGDQRYLRNPPCASGSKIIIADSDHLAPLRVTHVQFWKWFARGMHPILMDCGYQGLSWWMGRDFQREHAKWQQMRDAMGVIRSYAERMNLVDMKPQSEIEDGPSSTRYCLYSPGAEYLVYQPIPNTQFDVKLPPGKYRYEWIIPTSGKNRIGEVESIGGKEGFKAPFPWPAALYLRRI
jgi:hypothetical protein